MGLYSVVGTLPSKLSRHPDIFVRFPELTENLNTEAKRNFASIAISKKIASYQTENQMKIEILKKNLKKLQLTKLLSFFSNKNYFKKTRPETQFPTLNTY